MAFITHDEIVDNALKQIGLSLDIVTHYSPDAQQDQFSFSIGVETNDPEPQTLPVGTANQNPGPMVEVLKGMTLNPIAIIPRADVDSTGETCICFHNVYHLTVPDTYDQYPRYNAFYQYIADAPIEEDKTQKGKKQRRTGKKRGEYRLDPTNSYTQARRCGDFFLNKITVKASDLSESTWELLMAFMRERHNLKHSIAYTLADISAATFHRIQKAHPQKEILLKLGIVLQLSLEEMNALLASAGFTFNPSDKRDVLIKKCFQERVLNTIDINAVLYKEHLKIMEFGNFDRLNPR